MSARAWALWSTASLLLVLISTNPIYRVLFLLIALNMLLSLRRSDASLRPLLLTAMVGAGIAVVLNLLLSHTGVHVLVTVPDAVPGVGGPITVEAIVYGADVALGIAAALLAVAPLSRVLHPHELLDAMPVRLQRTAALLGAALNLVPGVVRSAVAISESQRLRGAERSRVRDARHIAVPVVLTTLEESLQLAEAMEARGFGSAPQRTRYAVSALRGADLAVIGAAAVSAALVVVARVSGGLPDWYPFPTVALPQIQPMVVVACVLLATPLVAWHRS